MSGAGEKADPRPLAAARIPSPTDTWHLIPDTCLLEIPMSLIKKHTVSARQLAANRRNQLMKIKHYERRRAAVEEYENKCPPQADRIGDAA